MTMTYEEKFISPEMAREMLATSGFNRAVQHARVLTFANEMRCGRWQMSGEDIIFDTNGKLIEGQHRLYAIIESGCTIQFGVKRGVPPEAFEVINTGKARTGGDIAGMAGHENRNLVVAGASMIWRLYHRLGPSEPCPPQVALRVLERYPELKKWAAVVNGQPKPTTLPGAAFLAILVYFDAISGKPDTASRFFTAITKGTGLNDGDPRLALRNRALNMRGSGTIMNTTTIWGAVARTATAVEAGELLYKLPAERGGGQMRRPALWESHFKELPKERRLDDLRPREVTHIDGKAAFQEFVKEVRAVADTVPPASGKMGQTKPNIGDSPPA
jgi:hypothetical protein